MPTLTPDDLQAYLTTHGIRGEMMHLAAETPTVAAAADALRVEVDQIVKTVLFLVDGQPYAVLANGVRRVDGRKLAARFGMNRKKVKLAGAEDVLRFTGYAPGAVPPLGHITPIPVLMAPSVAQQAVIFGGGGGLHTLLRMTSADLIAAVQPELLDVLETGLPPGIPESDA